MSDSRLPRLFVIDDDGEMQSLLQDYCLGAGYAVKTFSSAAEGLLALDAAPSQVDLVVSDIRMPGMSGFELVDRLQRSHPEIPVILITAFGSIDSALEAMRRGAHDYLVKPFKLAEIRAKLDRALEYAALRRDNRVLRGEIQKSWLLENMLGKSAAMQELFDLVRRVAQASTNVLISGESGTGKEMVARAIHSLGNRRDKPFVAVDCTSIPETLLESELFGHAKGSFTGAVQRKRGLFEEADGGTVFLDEIGDMPLSLQAKLLRVLQQRAIRPVGLNSYKTIDLRIVAATHKDLRQAIRDGNFREDLYFRLSVIPLVIPPLRCRQADIPLMADAFLAKYAAANGSKVRGFTKAAMAALVSAPWPGNVRELENVVERSVVLADGPLIEREDLPDLDQRSIEEFFCAATSDLPTVADLERRYIKLILEKTGGRKDRAAQILGIHRRTLYRKEREYGLVAEGADDFVCATDGELSAAD